MTSSFENSIISEANNGSAGDSGSNNYHHVRLLSRSHIYQDLRVKDPSSIDSPSENISDASNVINSVILRAWLIATEASDGQCQPLYQKFPAPQQPTSTDTFDKNSSLQHSIVSSGYESSHSQFEVAFGLANFRTRPAVSLPNRPNGTKLFMDALKQGLHKVQANLEDYQVEIRNESEVNPAQVVNSGHLMKSLSQLNKTQRYLTRLEAYSAFVDEMEKAYRLDIAYLHKLEMMERTSIEAASNEVMLRDHAFSRSRDNLMELNGSSHFSYHAAESHNHNKEANRFRFSNFLRTRNNNQSGSGSKKKSMNNTQSTSVLNLNHIGNNMLVSNRTGFSIPVNLNKISVAGSNGKLNSLTSTEQKQSVCMELARIEAETEYISGTVRFQVIGIHNPKSMNSMGCDLDRVELSFQYGPRNKLIMNQPEAHTQSRYRKSSKMAARVAEVDAWRSRCIFAKQGPMRSDTRKRRQETSQLILPEDTTPQGQEWENASHILNPAINSVLELQVWEYPRKSSKKPNLRVHQTYNLLNLLQPDLQVFTMWLDEEGVSRVVVLTHWRPQAEVENMSKIYFQKAEPRMMDAISTSGFNSSSPSEGAGSLLQHVKPLQSICDNTSSPLSRKFSMLEEEDSPSKLSPLNHDRMQQRDDSFFNENLVEDVEVNKAISHLDLVLAVDQEEDVARSQYLMKRQVEGSEVALENRHIIVRKQTSKNHVVLNRVNLPASDEIEANNNNVYEDDEDEGEKSPLKTEKSWIFNDKRKRHSREDLIQQDHVQLISLKSHLSDQSGSDESRAHKCANQIDEIITLIVPHLITQSCFQSLQSALDSLKMKFSYVEQSDIRGALNHFDFLFVENKGGDGSSVVTLSGSDIDTVSPNSPLSTVANTTLLSASDKAIPKQLLQAIEWHLNLTHILVKDLLSPHMHLYPSFKNLMTSVAIEGQSRIFVELSGMIQVLFDADSVSSMSLASLLKQWNFLLPQENLCQVLLDQSVSTKLVWDLKDLVHLLKAYFKHRDSLRLPKGVSVSKLIRSLLEDCCFKQESITVFQLCLCFSTAENKLGLEWLLRYLAHQTRLQVSILATPNAEVKNLLNNFISACRDCVPENWLLRHDHTCYHLINLDSLLQISKLWQNSAKAVQGIVERFFRDLDIHLEKLRLEISNGDAQTLKHALLSSHGQPLMRELGPLVVYLSLPRNSVFARMSPMLCNLALALDPSCDQDKRHTALQCLTHLDRDLFRQKVAKEEHKIYVELNKTLASQECSNLQLNKLANQNLKSSNNNY